MQWSQYDISDDYIMTIDAFEKKYLRPQETKVYETNNSSLLKQTSSNGTETTQITPEASSNDLEWKLECENCQSNDVICKQYNGHLYTNSDCKKYKKEALEIYKCKCICINNN